MVSWQGLNQWISAKGTLGNVWEHFWLTHCEVVLASGMLSLRMPLHALHSTGEPPTGERDMSSPAPMSQGQGQQSKPGLNDKDDADNHDDTNN